MSGKETGLYDVRIAVCGNVDAGKSTLVGVLIYGELDNGRGKVRSNVFTHPHEKETGRTSTIGRQIIGFNTGGECVNYSKQHKITWSHIIENSYKIITFLDLAGHEKYLKTTITGMSSIPDYCFVVVGANMGITKITREHIGLALALKIPIIIIMSKIDMCLPNIRQQTLSDIKCTLKMKGVNKLVKKIQNEEQLMSYLQNNCSDRLVPIFEVSSVTGEGLELLRKYLNIIPPRIQWDKITSLPSEFFIDETYSVTGVGTVVGGIVTMGIIKDGQQLLLGPDSCGKFKEVTVKSLHSNHVSVKEVPAGHSAGIALGKISRSDIHRGMVLVHPSVNPKATWTFEADIHVLSNSTTFKPGYQPVVQCMNIRQCAQIVEIKEKEVLRVGERARVKFKFMYRPEYLKMGMRMILREGHCKGIGIVTTVN